MRMSVASIDAQSVIRCVHCFGGVPRPQRRLGQPRQ
jgi:hypothetical protein